MTLSSQKGSFNLLLVHVFVYSSVLFFSLDVTYYRFLEWLVTHLHQTTRAPGVVLSHATVTPAQSLSHKGRQAEGGGSGELVRLCVGLVTYHEGR